MKLASQDLECETNGARFMTSPALVECLLPLYRTHYPILSSVDETEQIFVGAGQAQHLRKARIEARQIRRATPPEGSTRHHDEWAKPASVLGRPLLSQFESIPVTDTPDDALARSRHLRCSRDWLASSGDAERYYLCDGRPLRIAMAVADPVLRVFKEG